MQRYFIDLHQDSLSTWDDEGAEFASQSLMEEHVAALLYKGLPTSSGDHIGASVHFGDGHPIMTATLSRTNGLRLSWLSGMPESAVSSK